MFASPVSGTGYSEWVNDLWLLLLPIVLVIGIVLAIIDRIRK